MTLKLRTSIQYHGQAYLDEFDQARPRAPSPIAEALSRAFGGAPRPRVLALNTFTRRPLRWPDNSKSKG